MKKASLKAAIEEAEDDDSIKALKKSAIKEAAIKEALEAADDADLPANLGKKGKKPTKKEKK